jgi:hypothetical protein
MPAKEIKELRQSGKLEEALEMAKTELIADPANIWAKRNISWVYYDYLKKNEIPSQFDEFCSWLIEVGNLQLSIEDKMFFENLSWQTGKMIFALHKEHPADFQKPTHILEIVKAFPFPKPSESYSFLFKAFHKSLKESDNYNQFADWWGFDNLRQEDYEKEKLADGKEIMSIAEQAYITYAKHLLPKQVQPGVINFDREKAESFILSLDSVIKNYPQYQYPPYFKAKLLLALGDIESMRSTLIPFAKKKKNDFWVWDLLSETYPDDKEKVLSCYCKGLTCQAPEEMIVGLRRKMASLLVQKKLFTEAKTEIDLLTRSLQSKGFRIPQEVLNWREQEWYKKASAKPSNTEFYKKHSGIADGLLFPGVTVELIIVEFVNSDKKILNFIASKTRSGFFKYDRFIRKVEIGDRFLARLEGTGSNTRYNVISLEKTDKLPGNEILRGFSGKIRKNDNQTFGFVDDIFIEPQLINKYKPANGTDISGTAIISFNKKKNEWGWKAIKLF